MNPASSPDIPNRFNKLSLLGFIGSPSPRPADGPACFRFPPLALVECSEGSFVCSFSVFCFTPFFSVLASYIVSSGLLAAVHIMFWPDVK